jgi:hypothetical protein
MDDFGTQTASSAWCEEHYPDESIAQRLRNVAEELAELAVELGEDVDQLVDAIRASAARGPCGDGEGSGAPGEVADLQISVWSLASGIGLDASAEVDRKMREELLHRDPADSRARVERKEAEGLRSAPATRAM